MRQRNLVWSDYANLLVLSAWRTAYLLPSVAARLLIGFRHHFRRTLNRAVWATTQLGTKMRLRSLPRQAMARTDPKIASPDAAEPKTATAPRPPDLTPVAPHLGFDEKSVDIEEFLSRDFGGRIGLIRERNKTAARSAELARVWSHLLDYLIAKNAAPSILVPLARQTIVLNPNSPDVRRACEVLFPARETSLRTVVHMIISCEPRIHKALKLRGQLLNRKGHSIVVIVGRLGTRPDTFEDGIMTVDAPDTYEELPKKVMEALFAVRRRFGAVPVLKIDDDCAVVGMPSHSEIMTFIAEHQFAGELTGNELFDRCWHFGKCSSPVFNEPYEKPFLGSWPRGTLYYLSRQAVDLLVRNYIFYPGIIKGEIFEDKMVSDLLRSHGICPAHVNFGSIFGLTTNLH
jgi:hypothetical protein